MKIEVRKPQYLASKELTTGTPVIASENKTPFFFRLLLVFAYVFSAAAIWYVFQKFSAHS